MAAAAATATNTSTIASSIVQHVREAVNFILDLHLNATRDIQSLLFNFTATQATTTAEEGGDGEFKHGTFETSALAQLIEHVKLGLRAYVDAIEWKEPFILSLLAFHAVLLFTILATRKRMNIQTTIFIILLLLGVGASPLNNLGRRHWERFATQNYFDEGGFFISTLFSGPLVLFALIILVNMLITSSRLLIRVKRAQFREEHKKHLKEQQQQQQQRQEQEPGKNKDNNGAVATSSSSSSDVGATAIIRKRK